MNTRDDILTKDELGESGDRRAIPAPSLDLGKYRPLLADLGLSGEAGDEFLRELWKLSIMFVHGNVDVGTIPDIFPEIFGDASALSALKVDSSNDEDTDADA